MSHVGLLTRFVRPNDTRTALIESDMRGNITIGSGEGRNMHGLSPIDRERSPIDRD